MSKKFADFIPEAPEKCILVAIRIPESIHKQIKAELEKRKTTWPKLMTGLCKAFIEDQKSEKKK